MRTRSSGLRSSAGVLALALLTACGGHSPAAGSSPTPSTAASSAPTAATTPAATPTTARTPAPTPSGAVVASIASCTASVPSDHNLVLATVAGSTAVVLRDITNTAAAQTLCTFTGTVSPRFATAKVVGYTVQGSNLGSSGRIVRLDLAANSGRVTASWPAGAFDSGNFDWSPNGAALTYIGPGSAGLTWHLVSGGTDRDLASLPAVPGRGVSLQDDDFMIGFSPDGLYLAMVQTFATGGSGERAPLQVRRVSDGTLVYSATSGTMGVWASVPSRLFFRDTSGAVSSWDPSSGVSGMQGSLKWTRPHASPDGRWITYTIYDAAGHPHVGLYSVQGNSLGPQLAGLRSGALFLNNNLLWYQEESACDCGLAGQSQLTGRTFIFDIAAASEAGSRLTGVFDAWPRVTAPPSLGG